MHKNEPSGSIARDVTCSLVTQHRTSGPSKPRNPEALQQAPALFPCHLAGTSDPKSEAPHGRTGPTKTRPSIVDASVMGDWAMGDRCASRTTARWLHILPEVEVLEQSTQSHPTQPRPIRGSHGTLTNRVVSAIVPGPLRRSTVVRLIWNGIRPIVCNATNGWEWVCYSIGIRMLVSLGSLTTSIRGRSIPGRGDTLLMIFGSFGPNPLRSTSCLNFNPIGSRAVALWPLNVHENCVAADIARSSSPTSRSEPKRPANPRRL